MRKLLLLSLACLVGCQTVKRARDAQNEADLHPGEKTVSAQALGLTEGRVVSLKELEEIALQYHPDVVTARENVDSAMVSLGNAEWKNSPVLTANAGHSSSTDNTRLNSQSSRMRGKWSGGLNLNWTLLDFGRASAAEKKARQDYRSAVEELRKAEGKAVYNVRTAYFELKRCAELDKVAQQEIEQYKEHLERVKIQRSVGKSTAYQQTKAEVDWNNAVLNQLNTENNLKNAWGTLGRALGLAEEPVFSLGDGEMQEYPLEVESLLKVADEHEPGLASLNAKVEAASFYIDQTVAELYPTLSLSLGATLNGGLSPTPPYIWNLNSAASLAQTWFDGGARLRTIESAVIALRKARVQVASRHQELFQELRKAILVARHAEKQLEVSSLTERLARHNLEIVNEQFRVGRASSVERTDAQVSHSSASASLVSAKYSRQLAMASISHLIGDYDLEYKKGGDSK